MNAFKIDKSKIETLNTRYEEKAKELIYTALFVCLGIILRWKA